MLATAGAVIVKSLIDMGLRLLTAEFIEELLLYSAKKISAMTETKIDDDVVKMIEEKLTK